MSKHRKPHSRPIRTIVATLLGVVVATVLGVQSAVSFASTDRPSGVAINLRAIANSTADLKPHPRVNLEVKAQPLTVKVKPGESLSSIARRVLGSARDWPVLWYTNRRHVHNPNVILVGEVLRISHRHLTAYISRRAMEAIPKPPPPAPTLSHGSAVHVASNSSTGRRHRHYRAVAVTTYFGGSGFQACVIRAESGGNPAAVNPSSGAGGLYQFLPSTWASLGYAGAYPGGAQTAPVSVQNAAFWKLYSEAGTSPWAPYDGC